MDKWSSLQEGGHANFCFLSVDVVDHSQIVRGYSHKRVEPIFDAFEQYVDDCVKSQQGRLLNWAGDGGLAAFYEGEVHDKTCACVQVAFAILKGLAAFNKSHPFPRIQGIIRDRISVRIAVHPGEARYRFQTGRMHSEAINFVSHLEHERTHVNSVSASEDAYKEIKEMDCCNDFVEAGIFERRAIYTNDKKRGPRFEKTNPQIGPEVPVLAAGRREIRARVLVNTSSTAPVLLSWDTFGEGMKTLKKQIEEYPTPNIVPDLCVGINFAGTQVAAFLCNELGGGLTYLGTVRTAAGGTRTIRWQSLPINLKKVHSIVVVDSEMKSGFSANMVVEALKSKYPNARVWLAVLALCGVEAERSPRPLTFANTVNCLPDFVAFVTRGRIEPPERLR